MLKMTLDPFLVHKIRQRLKCSSLSYKSLGRKYSSILCNLGLGKVILNMTSKAETTNKTGQQELIKIKDAGFIGCWG